MLYYLTAVGLIAHTCFWGFGLAFLTLPRVWRRWVWMFAPGFGFALQSAVVWGGAHTSMAGTNSYAWWSELLPFVLLVAALYKKSGRIAWRFPGLLLVTLFTGWLFLSPMTKPGTGLTTSSLGNCDQADYAAGARVFQEFSRDDRTGFLGLSEVTKVRSADYFFDFWVRLNHFTPSALIAHNAAAFGVPSFRLVSVSAAAVLLLNLPVVFLFARVVVGMRGIWLVAFLSFYAVSPLSAYAIYHGQLGQLYAAQGIALLTLAVFGASRMAHAGREVWSFLPLMFVSFWLLAGSYNFILPVCLAPGGTWLLIQLWQRRNWSAVGKVVITIAGGLVLCGVFFWGRFDGLIERFSLFHQYNFGWAMPLFSPEGWLGVVRDSSLHAWPFVIRMVLNGLVLGLWIAGLVFLLRRRRPEALAALALVLPVMAGWSMLAWESRVRANASYDAYKLMSVFLPGLLAGLLCWIAVVQKQSRAIQAGAASLLLALLVVILSRDGHFQRQMANPPLRVNRNIAELALLEKDPRFLSFNLLVEDYWSRLWANAFLLKRPQYFVTHSYEGRMNTALKGEWNLSDSLLRSVPLQADDFLQFNVRFFLVRANAPGLLQINYADGWYGEERSGPKRWRWCNGRGRLVLHNPTGRSVRTHLRLLVQSFLTRDLMVQIGDQQPLNQHLDGSSQVVEFESFSLPPGSTTVTLTSDAVSAGISDDRKLAFALYGFELRTLGLE
jgi:hypothetical protein